jgi:aspartate 1-decarboxylase
VGDEVIIVSYVIVDQKEAKTIKPKVITVDGKNRVKN